MRIVPLAAALFGLVGGLLHAGCSFDRSGLGPNGGTDGTVRDSALSDARPRDGTPRDGDIPVCGDNVREGNEPCDGSDFGNTTCQSLGFDGGFLTCNNCTLNTSQCYGGPAWSCRIPITISNLTNPSTLTDYQIWVQVQHRTGMQQDFSDIRFGDDLLTVQYDYWIESRNAGVSAGVWVKVPVIAGNSATTIYLHYGNQSAPYVGDPEAVFEFFDDFESGTVDKWDRVAGTDYFTLSSTRARSGTWSLSSTNVNQNWNAAVAAGGFNFNDIAFESWWYVNTANMDVGQTVRASAQLPLNYYEGGVEPSQGWNIAEHNEGAWNEIEPNQGTMATNTWFKVTVIIVSDSMKVLINNVQVVPAQGWTSVGYRLSGGTVGFRTWYIPQSGDWWIDDTRVRKATDPEPTTTVGQHECFPY
jgi:hypothetical protein